MRFRMTLSNNAAYASSAQKGATLVTNYIFTLPIWPRRTQRRTSLFEKPFSLMGTEIRTPIARVFRKMYASLTITVPMQW